MTERVEIRPNPGPQSDFLRTSADIAIGGAVLLNAHPSRTGLTTGNLDGGSTAWSNSVRSRWSLARQAAEEGTDEDPDARVLTRRKANYARIGDEIRLRWTNGALLPLAGETGQAPGHRVAADEIFLTLLDRLTTEGRRVSSSKNAPNFAPKEFARCPDRAGLARKDFEAAMQSLFLLNRIRVETYGRPGDARQMIVRAAPNPPGGDE